MKWSLLFVCALASCGRLESDPESIAPPLSPPDETSRLASICGAGTTTAPFMRISSLPVKAYAISGCGHMAWLESGKDGSNVMLRLRNDASARTVTTTQATNLAISPRGDALLLYGTTIDLVTLNAQGQATVRTNAIEAKIPAPKFVDRDGQTRIVMFRESSIDFLALDLSRVLSVSALPRLSTEPGTLEVGELHGSIRFETIDGASFVMGPKDATRLQTPGFLKPTKATTNHGSHVLKFARFHGPFLYEASQRFVACGDTECPEKTEANVLYASGGLVAQIPLTNLALYTYVVGRQERRSMIELPNGSLVFEREDGLTIVRANGQVWHDTTLKQPTALGQDSIVAMGRTAGNHIVVRGPSQSLEPLEAPSGWRVASFTGSNDGSKIAVVYTENSGKHRLALRSGTSEKILGWSPGSLEAKWVGDDGVVLVNGDVLAGNGDSAEGGPTTNSASLTLVDSTIHPLSTTGGTGYVAAAVAPLLYQYSGAIKWVLSAVDLKSRSVREVFSGRSDLDLKVDRATQLVLVHVSAANSLGNDGIYELYAGATLP